MDNTDIKKIMGIVAGAILLNWALQNISTIVSFLGSIMNLLSPFLVGLCIAFILNVPIQVLESKLFKKKSVTLRRLVSLSLTVVLMLALVLLVLYIVIPEIGQTVETLLSKLPRFIDGVTTWGKQLSSKFPNLGVWLSKMKLDWDNIGKTVFSFLKSGVTSIMNSIVGIAASVFSGVFNFFLGFIFAVYVLLQKEQLARQVKKLLVAYLSEARADRILSICTLVNQTFSKFITGQCTEAVILGLMFLILMSLFRFPYAVVIAILVTSTALIPIFGALIACFIGTFLILVISPVKAVWFVVLFLGLQQIEGNFIYPRVVGSSIGLPALWVMSAVIIGGGAMGVAGMLISVPLCSVLYVLLRESVRRRLAEKHIAVEKRS